MKKMMYLLAGMSVLLGIGCSEKTAFVMEGTIDGKRDGVIYLSSVKNRYEHSYTVVDSAIVKDGKFRMERKELRPELYLLGDKNVRSESRDMVFLEPGKIKAQGKVDKDGNYTWEIEGSKNHEVYNRFSKEQYIKSGQAQMDSLDVLFYAAREKGDRAEMARIKELSIEIYYRGDSITNNLAEQYVRDYKNDAIALYLYRKHIFPKSEYIDTMTIHKTMDYVKSFGERAKKSVYYDNLMQRLNKLDQCAVGRKAHDIVGLDTLGNQVKLSDFRGKYVLVDFWNSYCHWCREESPNMRRALAECGDDFTILGVSNDPEKDLWMDAIHTDKAYWNQILQDRKAWNDVSDLYCITGIPFIFLVNPEGIIVAKDVRGEDIIKVPKKFMGIM